MARDDVIAVLERHRVCGHYRATAAAGARLYAVFRSRDDGSAEQVSEPAGHAETVAKRNELIADEIVALASSST